MPKGKISIDRIVDNGLETQEGLIQEFDYPDSTDSRADVSIEFLSGLLQKILPGTSMPRERRFTSGYRRFVVLVWMVYPDAFGSASVKDIADQIGTTIHGVYKIQNRLKSIVGSS